jgi:membrane protein
MAVLLTYLKVPLTWSVVFKRTFKEAFWNDNCLGMAAQLAYYFFFALFPALLFVLAVASYFPVEALVDDLFRNLGGFVPPEALRIITEQLTKISEGEQGGLLTFGVLTALWSSSAAMTAIIDTLNAAYDIEEGRPWWKVRLIAIALTIGVAIFILISFTLILVGPRIAEIIAARTPLGSVFVWTWKVLQWPIAFALASAGIAIIYYFAPDAEQDWVWLTPGSMFATATWLAASLGFKYYVANMGTYTETYGAIGGVMVLMLWFYISGIVLLLGAEMNAEIEHASPYGKDEGEKVPGQRRKIGSARMRESIAKQRARGEKPPSASEVKDVVGPTPADKEPGAPVRDSRGAPTPERAIAPTRDGGVAPNPDSAMALTRDRSIGPTSARLAAPAAASTYLIGAGAIAAQLWFTLKSLRKPRVGA